MYILLDGHLRLEVLKAIGGTEALYLISTDDERLTYNREINCLIPIPEHKMISAAQEKGMEATRIAQELEVNLDRIHERENLLNGIAAEVVKMLNVRMVTQDVFRALRQIKPIRQN